MCVGSGAYVKGQEIDVNGLASLAVAELHRHLKRCHLKRCHSVYQKKIRLIAIAVYFLTHICGRKAKLLKIYSVKSERTEIIVKATKNSAVQEEQ